MGGDALQVATGVPADMVTALEGLVVVFVVSLEYMRRRSRATSLSPTGRGGGRPSELGPPGPDSSPLVTVSERSDP